MMLFYLILIILLLSAREAQQEWGYEPSANEMVAFTIDAKDALRLSSDSWPSKKYRLKQFHLHWSQNDSTGSEHVIFGRRFPLEFYFVHYDYSLTFDQAKVAPLCLTVVSVLFEFGKTQAEIANMLRQMKKVDDPEFRPSVLVRNLILRQLLPNNRFNSIQNGGSLTTPPCSESVNWIILTHMNSLTHNQVATVDGYHTNNETMKMKRIIYDANGKALSEIVQNNDRTVQDLNGRLVNLHYTFDDIGL